MIYTVTLNPALDRTATIPDFQLDAVNRIADVRVDAGGKGINVSRWVRALGGQSVAMGILGGATGDVIRRTLEKEGVETDFVAASAPTRTNTKIIDPVRGTHTDINEPGPAASPPLLSKVFAQLTDRVAPGDIVVLAGKSPPGAPDTLQAEWTRALKKLGAKVFVDADGAALRAAMDEGPYLIKPNVQELAALDVPLGTQQEVASAARTLIAGGTERVVISMGGEGALFFLGEEAWTAPALKVPVGSTVGAGDAMVGALAYAELMEMPPKEAVCLAIAAGAASVMQPGTGVAPRAEIIALAHRVQPRPFGV